MKKMLENKGKTINLVFAFVMLVAMMFASIEKVSAETSAPASISLGATKGQVNALVGTTPYFPIKAMTDGTFVYCLNHNKDIAKNVTEYKVGELDAAIAYIIRSNPNTGNTTKDYYIKQVAVWWYLDEVKGGSNLKQEFYNQPNTGIKKQVYDLKEAAKKNNSYATTSIKINSDSTSLTESGSYYVTPVMTVTSSNITTFKVSVSNAPTGTIITDANGNVKETFNSNESFMVKVPTTSVSVGSKVNMTVAVSATGTVYKAYEYKPNNTSIQNVATIYPDYINVNDNKVFTLEKTNTIYISKQDATNSQELPGAELTLYDSNMKVVETWVSESTPHPVYNLKDGKYYLKEVNAPKGYVLSTDTVEFEVKNGKVEKPVIMINYPAKGGATISKHDITNSEELPGATLIIKDAQGTEIKRWVSGNTPVYFELDPGTYTLTEVQAPEGYVLSTEVITFEVKADGSVTSVIMNNAPEVEVPNTASNVSIIVYILGIAGIVFGATMVIKKVKENA